MIPKNLLIFLVGMALFFTWSCDSETVSKGKSGTKEPTVTIKQENTGASYTFSVDIFMWEDYPVFQDDKVDTATQKIWDKVFLRWGFRKKPTLGAAEMPIYWVQKATNDNDISGSYAMEVDETLNHLFTPEEKFFPSELLPELEGSLEIYLQLQVDTVTISAQLAMPADFKTKLGIGNGGPPASKAITGSFTYTNIMATEGTAQTAVPSWTGANAQQTLGYSIASAPTEITLNPNTGSIEVSATAGVQAPITYTVTATGTGNYTGFIIGAVQIEVQGNNMNGLSFTYAPVDISETKVYTMDPTWIGGTPAVTYAITSPANGISVDTASGKISVEADTVKLGSYTIMATDGSSTRSTSVMVNRPTPADRTALQKLTAAAIRLNPTVNLNYIDTSQVTDMNSMFNGAVAFNGDISGWNVSSVTNMFYMFREAAAFNGDISGWDVSSVTSMHSMFRGAAAFNQNLNNWDVSSVTSMYTMFSGAAAFNQNLNNWDVSSVTDMISMFSGAAAFNQNLNNWDVSSVTNMSSMFFSAPLFNGDISGWIVSSVTDMSSMFSGATAFNQNLNNWVVATSVTKTSMFNGSGVVARPSWYP